MLQDCSALVANVKAGLSNVLTYQKNLNSHWLEEIKT